MTPTIKQSDPRIISPTIKVIYPSEAVAKSETEATTAQPAVAQTAPIKQTYPTEQQPAQLTTTPTDTATGSTDTPATTTTPAAATAKKWLDVVKENATLFLIVFIVAVGCGILIGKKI